MVYDKNFNNFIQTNNSPHNAYIIYIDIYDENNFVTCSYDKSIKTWIKNNNKYSINKIINNAHNDYIYKIIYNSKGNLISCADDGLIKIWELENEQYKNIKTFNNNNYVRSILLLEDKNILISFGYGTKFWDLNENKLLKSFDNIKTVWNNGLERIDGDKIIVAGGNSSISKLEIIKEIKINHGYFSITLIKNKGLLLAGGLNNNIYVYRSDNYELIQTINNAHGNIINGFIEINNYLISSYARDNSIKNWLF